MTLFNLLIYASCFIGFFMQTGISWQHNSNRLFNDQGKPASQPGYLTALYISGIMWLAFFPLVLRNDANEIPFIQTGTISTTTGLGLFLLTGLFVFTGIKSSRQIIPAKENQIHLNKFFIAYYVVLRIAFLFSYELFFRGFLLFDVSKFSGIPVAIMLSTCLTVSVHVFNSKKEMLACVPFGVILSGCCLLTTSVLPAVVMHIALCMSYELPVIHQLFIRLKPAK